MGRRKIRGGYESDHEPKPLPKVSPGPAQGAQVIDAPSLGEEPPSAALYRPAQRCSNCGRCPECGR